MKKISASIAFLLLLTVFSVGTHAQTVDEIVNKHIEARGGIDKIHAIKSVVMDGTLFQMGNEIAMKFYQVQNKATKVEFTVMDQTGYNIITTTNGWAYNPFAGNTSAEPLPEDQVKMAQANLDIQGPLVDYQSKGSKIEYLGKEKINNVDCFKLKVTRSNGKAGTYYLDNNYLIVKTITTALANGAEQEVTTEYSDYKKTADGYLVSYKRTSTTGDITFSKIEFNTTIADDVFKPSN
ncbi:MAG: hypothetical protein QM731_03525 [Chitinophagaceae bacterium]